MPYKVNPRAWYSEVQILKVWDTYIQSKGLKYYTGFAFDASDSEYRSSLFGESHARKSMNIHKNAGLLLYSDGENAGKLYKQARLESIRAKTISISGSVDHIDSSVATGSSAITSDIADALSQIKSWNDKQLEKSLSSRRTRSRNTAALPDIALMIDLIRDHVILFAYHMTPVHWGLGALDLQFNTDGVLEGAKIKALDPMSNTGTVHIDVVVITAIEEKLNEIFTVRHDELDTSEGASATPAVRLIQNPEPFIPDYRMQQHDADSCGVISAENGKDIIDGILAVEQPQEGIATSSGALVRETHPSIRLRAVYESGAGELRNQHLEEVDDRAFEAMQMTIASYSSPGFTLPDSIVSVREAFKKLLKSSDTDSGTEPSMELRAALGKAFRYEELVTRALAIRDLFDKDKDFFKQIEIDADSKKNNLFDFLFTGKEGECSSLNDGAVDLLSYIKKTVISVDIVSLPALFTSRAHRDTQESKVQRLFEKAEAMLPGVDYKAYEYSREDVEKVIEGTDLIKRRLLECEIVEIDRIADTENEGLKEAEVRGRHAEENKSIQRIVDISKEQILRLFKKVSGELKSEYLGQISSSILIFDRAAHQWSSMLFSILNNEIYLLYYSPTNQVLEPPVSEQLKVFCESQFISLVIAWPRARVGLDTAGSKEELEVAEKCSVKKGYGLEQSAQESSSLMLGKMYQILSKVAYIDRKLDLQSRLHKKAPQKTVEEDVVSIAPAASTSVGELYVEFRDEGRIALFQSKELIEPELLESVSQIRPFKDMESLKRFYRLNHAELYYADLLRELAHESIVQNSSEKLINVLSRIAKIYESKSDLSGNPEYYTEAAKFYQYILSISRKHSLNNPRIDGVYNRLDVIKQKLINMISILSYSVGLASNHVKIESDLDKKYLEQLRRESRIELEAIDSYLNSGSMSEEMQDEEFIYKSRKLFEKIATDLKVFLRNLVKESEFIIWKAPCGYTVVGLGSIALSQATPYSDLEFAVLTENDNYRSSKDLKEKYYFKNLIHLVHFRVINLGETIIPKSKYGVDLEHLITRALNFDLGGKTPLGRIDRDKPYTLIQTVDKMLKYLKNENKSTEYIDKALHSILESTVYVYGEEKLLETYKAQATKFLSEKATADDTEYTNYQLRAIKRLKESPVEKDYLGTARQPLEAGSSAPHSFKKHGNVALFKPDFENIGKPFDVKQEIYRLPDRYLYDLAFYYGIEPKSVWDAIEQLKEQGVIGGNQDSGNRASNHLLYAASFATALRLRTYLHNEAQKEVMSIFSSEDVTIEQIASVFHLPKKELRVGGALFKYYHTVFPLYISLEEFLKKSHVLNGFQISKAFIKYTFFDKSDLITAMVYQKLSIYCSAIKYYEQFLFQGQIKDLRETINSIQYNGKWNIDIAIDGVAFCYSMENQYDIAVAYYEKALVMRKHHWGEMHEYSFDSCSRLASCYSLQELCCTNK